MVVHVAGGRLSVGLSAKASKTFFVDIHSQRVHAVYKHVDPQVIFQVLH